MQRYSIIGLSLLTVAGLAWSFAIAQDTPKVSGCRCVDCACPDCNGEFCTCDVCKCGSCGCRKASDAGAAAPAACCETSCCVASLFVPRLRRGNLHVRCMRVRELLLWQLVAN